MTGETQARSHRKEKLQHPTWTRHHHRIHLGPWPRIAAPAYRRDFFSRQRPEKRSQGGVEFPTGGHGERRLPPSARARERPLAVCAGGVSRPGVIPGPTVTVRMQESANLPGAMGVRTSSGMVAASSAR